MSTQPKSFVIISNEPWGKQWYSKHHYANELSKLGHQVYYLNPPKPWSPANLFNAKVEIQSVNDRLSVVKALNPFPVKLFTKFFTWLNDVILFKRVKRAIGISEDTIMWQFDFNRFVYRPKRNRKSVYHVADPYMHAWSDLILARRANLVICTSPKYVSYYNDHVDPGKVIHIPHGISIDEFDISDKEVARIEKEQAPFFLLIGSLNDDIDYDLMNEVASKVKLVILGSEKIQQEKNQLAWDRLKAHQRIEYLGTIPATELKNYIASAKCCLLLYRFDLKKAIGTGSPLKVMNYLAQFKPVISSIDPEIPKFLDNSIYWAKNDEDYLKLIDQAEENSLSIDHRAIESYLDGHKYPELINKVFTAIDG